MLGTCSGMGHTKGQQASVLQWLLLLLLMQLLLLAACGDLCFLWQRAEARG